MTTKEAAVDNEHQGTSTLDALKRNITERSIESWVFIILASIAQVVFLVLFYVFTDYEKFATTEDAANHVRRYYKMQLDVAGMVFVGFGFLMTFLKKYGFSSFGMNFMISALAVQWGILVMGFFHAVKEGFKHKILMDVAWLVEGNFAAATVLISFGGVLGKISPAQLVLMMLLEILFYSVNFYVGYMNLNATDAGGSMYIHSFGAYFGLAVSFFMTKKESKNHPDQGSRYNSDLFSLIGTIFLWLYWPSFNGALTTERGQVRVVIHTLLSLAGSTSATFLISRAFRGKWEMEDIQNATLAGGVAMGTCADLFISAGGAISIGFIGGAVSTLGFIYLNPLVKKIGLYDTCGIHNLHGMPGIIGALAGIVATGIGSAYPEKYGVEYSDFLVRGTKQAGFQAAALAITLGIAIVGGTITGVIIRWFFPPKQYFTDAEYWHLPSDEFLGGEEVEEIPSASTESALENNQDKELVEVQVDTEPITPVTTVDA